MIFKHATNLTMSKFSLVYKLIVFCSIIILIFTALGIGVIAPITKELFNRINEEGVFASFATAFNQFIKGDTEYYLAFQNVNASFEAIMAILSENSLVVTGSLLLIVVFIVICSMFINLGHIPTVDVVNSFMSTKSKFGFTSNFVANLKISFKYTLFRSIITIIFDVGFIALALYLSSLIFKLSILFALFFMSITIVGIFSLRQTFLTYWLPCIVVDNKSVFKSFMFSIKTAWKKFIYLYGYYFISYLCLMAFALVFGLFTFGVGFIFVVPLLAVFNRCIELVFYYNLKGYSFYTSVDKVIDVDVVEKVEASVAIANTTQKPNNKS